MKLLFCLSLALLIPAAAEATNEDPPLRKAGLWSISSEGAALHSTIQMCVDAESERKTLASAKAFMASTCSKVESSVSGNAYTQDSVCDLMGAKHSAHSVTTMVDEGTLVTVVSSQYDPPKPGLSAKPITQTQKWLGPCGAEIKPGQMLINGKIITPPGF